jgi:hypothetical protein
MEVHRMKRTVTGLVLVALLTGPVAGTTLKKKNLAELARESEAIVVAKVVGNTAAWDADRRLIWTETTLLVIESWKGALEGQVAIKEPGGEVGPVGQHVPGMARYQPGDTVVVFMKKDVLGQWRTHGCIQGLFRVVHADRRNAPEIGSWTRHVVAGFVGKNADMASFKKTVETLVNTTPRRTK